MPYNPHMVAIALAGAVSAAAAVAAGYQTMAPQGQWYGKTFTRGAPGARQLALTYDDGPHERFTRDLLEVLARHNVKATFFVIGKFARQRPEILREIVQAGHTIGNHTFSHPLLIFKSESEIRRQLSDCRAVLHDAIGTHSKLFRPPFGGRRPAVLRVASQLKMEPVMWSVAGQDWKEFPASGIESVIAKQITGGDVILLHDGGHKGTAVDRSQTVLASDHLIARYKAEGYEFLTIPEMMARSRPVSSSASP